MRELASANLWDGIGCGGSQKCEIATIEAANGPENREQNSTWTFDWLAWWLWAQGEDSGDGGLLIRCINLPFDVFVNAWDQVAN